MNQTPDQIIRLFCDAWSHEDLDEIMGYFDDAAIYHNIPMEVQEGKDNIRGFIEGFLSMASSIEFEILQEKTAHAKNRRVVVAPNKIYRMQDPALHRNDYIY